MSTRWTQLAAALALLCACADPATPHGGESAGAEAPAPAALPDDLSGSWAEFWAPKGDADSPRYLLLADGRFGWVAARDTAGDGPRQMSGTWSRAGDSVALQVARRRLADGTVETPTEAAPLSLQLGACPDNSEARAVDPQYACISLDGQAYFRRPADSVAEAGFFE